MLRSVRRLVGGKSFPAFGGNQILKCQNFTYG